MSTKVRLTWVFAFFLAIHAASASVAINEIMYDPSQCSDSYCEWVELYSNESIAIDLQNWTICNKKLDSGYINNSNNNTYYNATSIVPPGGFALITDGGSGSLVYNFFNVSTTAIALHVNSSTLCSPSGLANTNETLVLKDSSGNVIDNITYSSLWGANGNGKSLEKINNSWLESSELGGTPGRNNTAMNSSVTSNSSGQGLKLSVIVFSPLYLGVVYDGLFKIENIGHISGTTDHINATVYYNITNASVIIKQGIFNVTDLNSYKTADTGEFIPNHAGNFTICGQILSSTIQDNITSDDSDCDAIEVFDPSTIPCNVSLSIVTNQTIYSLGNTIKFYNVLSNDSFPYIIEYWAEDLFGDITKSKVNTSNQNQKSWTPDFDEPDKAYLLKSRLVWLACNDSNQSDNEDELLVAFKGAIAKLNPNSSIQIESADNESSFGGIVYVKVQVYKGDTSAYAITAEIKQGSTSVSEETKFYAYTKYTNYSLKLPIQLYGNCDKKYADGSYTLAVSGLSQSDSREIRLYGSSEQCSSSSGSSSSLSASSKFSYELVQFPEKITSGQEFISKVRIESDDKDHELQVYSYVYRGSKCYSGERDGNLQKVFLEADSSVIVELKNTAYAAESGNYSFKVKIRKDELKTEKEITVPVYVSAQVKPANKTDNAEKSAEKTASAAAPGKKDEEWYFNRVDEPVTVFLSPAYKAKRALLYSLLGLFAALNVFLLVKKKII